MGTLFLSMGNFLMVNQKGQAFSVFELMIAGVVAFAILMVLMQIIGGVLTGQDTDALDSISSKIKAVQPSGQDNTGNFVLKKGVTIDATDLASKTDLDEGSFVFLENELVPEVEVSFTGESIGDYIKYTGSQQKHTLSAFVICKPTAQQLENTLARFGDDDRDIELTGSFQSSSGVDSSSDSSLLRGADDDSGCINGLPCCAIIPMKRVN